MTKPESEILRLIHPPELPFAEPRWILFVWRMRSIGSGGRTTGSKSSRKTPSMRWVPLILILLRSHSQIMREHRSQTTGAALARVPCSFCNHSELVGDVSHYTSQELDITLLESAVSQLRDRYKVPEIQSHRLVNNLFQACRSCKRCISGSRFVELPFLSWANGCWIGDRPDELSDLTYVEELVISRAHTTKSWFKLTAGPIDQRAAHGNVCIHPHEITNLAKTLPRPISSLYDEIVVIFVSGKQAATADRFER